MVQILTREELGSAKWEEFISNHENSSIFHTPQWHKTIENSYRLTTQYHVIFDPGGAIRSAIPSMNVRNLFLGKRTVCFPYSDHCDPLLGDPEDFGELTNSVMDHSPNGNVEFRFYKVGREVPGLNQDDSYVNYVLPLRSENAELSDSMIPDSCTQIDLLFSSLHKSCIQRQIRKAQKNGVTVRQGKSLADLKQFYNLHLLTRKRHGVPAQPFRFFKKLRSEFGKGFKLLIADHDGNPVSAIILLWAPSLEERRSLIFRRASEAQRAKMAVYYKFGASNPLGLRLGANPLLFWQAIRRAVELGFQEFDLGRTSRADRGLADFKRHLGAAPKPLTYLAPGKSTGSLENGPLNSVAGSVFSVLPTRINQMSGSLFYRYLG